MTSARSLTTSNKFVVWRFRSGPAFRKRSTSEPTFAHDWGPRRAVTNDQRLPIMQPGEVRHQISPAWSPNGDRIAFRDVRGIVHIVNSDGSSLRSTGRTEFNDDWGGPA